jgi:thiosulfate reductase/polysulfide reductase chain A
MANRRDFIKIAGLGTASIALANPALKALGNTFFSAADAVTAGLHRTPMVCEICFWKCAGWTYKKEDGTIWKLEGNADDPNCNGRLCPRGTGGVGTYLDPDRLKTPLIRTGERGNQTFREATWDEALDYIAEKMKVIAAESGPESIALFSHRTGSTYFNDMLKAFGSSTYAAPSYAQCKGPREEAFYLTFGETIGSPERTDIRDTKCLVLIGSHLGENMHNGQVQEMSDAIDKGASIITVDPRFSTAAGKSKFWLPIKPATDMALLLAWINVLITEGWYDREYVEKYTFGFEQLKAHVRNFTPEWAYGITTIKPDVIRDTAREMFNASPAVIIHPGRHTTWYGDDTQRLRAVAILNALLGSWGRRGGFYNPDRISLPQMPRPEFPKPARTWRDYYPGKYVLAGEGVSNVLVDASIPDGEREPFVKAWFVDATNLIETLPDKKRTLEAIDNLELIVAIDIMPMEITGYADVVLPEATYLERYDDIRVSPGRVPTMALRMPAFEPQYNSKPGWWIARELGLKLGLQDYYPWENIEELLEWQLKQVDSSLDEMKRIGVKVLPRSYDDIYFAPDEEIEFGTATGKIELYSTQLADLGFDAMPRYTPHPQPPEGYYRLIYGRAPMHTFSRTSNNQHLRNLMDENNVWVNPAIAKRWGIENGMEVWLRNQDGVVSNFPIKVRVTERIRWDSVYMVHGFGHGNKLLTRCFGKGASDTQLITNVKIDPVMGGTGMRENFVTFLFEPEEVIS